MRWLRYSRGSAARYGILEGDVVIDVEGDPFAGYAASGKRLPLAEVKIELPVLPGTMYATGKNYDGHLTQGSGAVGKAPPGRPIINYRAASGLTPHGAPVRIPPDATDMQYEGELVAVIGKVARNVSVAEAPRHVLGYTIGNDVTERAWLKADHTLWRAKNSDTFSPLGPWIDTDARIEGMRTSVCVNGKEQIAFATGDMLHSVEQCIAAISQYITLLPGDVIWMGTDGVAPNLSDGDVVDIEISGVGTLSNRFVRDRAG